LIQIKSNGEQKTQPFQSYSPETATVAPEARGGEGGSLALPLSNEVSTLMKGDGDSGDSDQSIIELLEDTYLSCQTAVEILNDILSYDKLEASDMKLNYSVVDVKSLLERCISPFSVQVRHLPLFLTLTLTPLSRDFINLRRLDRNMFI
jgi:signal transduction histidine kinase